MAMLIPKREVMDLCEMMIDNICKYAVPNDNRYADGYVVACRIICDYVEKGELVVPHKEVTLK